MKNLLQQIWSAKIAGNFIAGIFALLPVMLTFIILEWVSSKLSSIFGPGSLIGDMLASGGEALVGQNHRYLSFIIGILIALVCIWAIGIFAKSLAKNQFDKNMDRVFERLPIIRSIYKPVSQVVKLFNRDESDELSGMSVVSCRMGGENGVNVLALMPPQAGYRISGKESLMIYLPTSPIPMTGALVLMNREAVIPMPDISVDELMQIYLSMGLIVPQGLRSHQA
tara:strand:- start:185 stop:859 length:675 start_codon:yes stop_codon:yes gene_type:complete